MVKFAGMTGTPGDNIWEISWSNNAQNNVKNNNSELSLKSDYNWRMEFMLDAVDATDFFQLSLKNNKKDEQFDFNEILIFEI